MKLCIMLIDIKILLMAMDARLCYTGLMNMRGFSDNYVSDSYETVLIQDVNRKNSLQLSLVTRMRLRSYLFSFRAFFTSIALEPDKGEKIVLTAFIRHTYIREESLKHTDVSDAEDSH